MPLRINFSRVVGQAYKVQAVIYTKTETACDGGNNEGTCSMGEITPFYKSFSRLTHLSQIHTETTFVWVCLHCLSTQEV